MVFLQSIQPIDIFYFLRYLSLYEVDKFCVKDIAALKLPVARLAYLSACTTANSTSPNLVDVISWVPSILRELSMSLEHYGQHKMRLVGKWLQISVPR
ncbi:hypothetical protein L211DRAFT_516077 [Terfezia boudieri ATCC MYA-4762]|uniref:CHAT domain-containing protein n=1 Tax=Terfezia boudieri ATCC MYA-4762 TaxID=1051890 RepID=A0A3N4LCD3_9PEZI|nr:hypothetical protein L211DRAFT_516077 [Terfezia boudieri ATCC MYA-4762]